jgi:hypothetical protein
VLGARADASQFTTQFACFTSTEVQILTQAAGTGRKWRPFSLCIPSLRMPR